MKVLERVRFFGVLACGLLIAMVTAVQAKPQPHDPNSTEVFITIGDYQITEAVFMAALRTEARQRFYHGRINAERFAQLKQDVTERLVTNTLLMLEAEKRQLEPPSSLIEAELAKLEKRYAADPNWPSFREQYLSQVTAQIVSRERIRMIEQSVRERVTPTAVEVKAYYQQNPMLFTLPASRQVGLILIKVDPSSPAEKWQETENAMEALRQRALLGESFETLAQSYSQDSSAQQGGDMGFLHDGMLHADVEKVLQTMQVGEVSAPIRLLEGYVIVKLKDTKPPKLYGFDEIQVKVREALTLNMADQAWQAFLQSLRDQTQIKFSDKLTQLALE